MARRMVGILLVSVLGAVVFAMPVFARGSAVQATDPSANSPAGVVYSIPLDSARQDASPHGHSGGGAGAGGGGIGGGGGNGSGSSGGGTGSASGSGTSGSGTSGSGTSGSGTSGAGATGSGNATGSGASPTHAFIGSKAPVLVPGGQPGSLVHSSNGFGSSSSVPSLNAPASAGLGAVQSNASSAPLLAILLAAVVLVLGGYVGVRSWRVTRSRALASGPPAQPQLPSGSE